MILLCDDDDDDDVHDMQTLLASIRFGKQLLSRWPFDYWAYI
jgi:hypothetical protein